MLSGVVRTLNAIFEKITYCALVCMDRVTGLDFHEMDRTFSGDGYIYECTHPRIMLQLARICRCAKTSDAMLDVGCGKGRMLAFFSRYRFRAVDGVEYDGRLAAVAARNIHRLGLESKVFYEDARQFSHWEAYNWFYFYNPFPGHVMEACLRGITRSAKTRPRRIVILYANPTCHHLLLAFGFQEQPFAQTIVEQIWHPYLSVLKMYVWNTSE